MPANLANSVFIANLSRLGGLGPLLARLVSIEKPCRSANFDRALPELPHSRQ